MGQEAEVRTGHETTDRFKTGKGIQQDYISSLCLFNFYAEYIMRNASIFLKHFHHFLVYNSVALSVFTVLCNITIIQFQNFLKCDF